MVEKTCLLDMNIQELEAYVQEKGESKFRGKQPFSWLHKGVSFQEMSNLSLEFRNKLAAEAIDQPVKISQSFVSAKDETVKFLYSFPDGNCVEGVLMKYHYGYTLCISTQVGCNMGCAFCASTLEGRVRNISAGEMLGQIIAANNFLSSEEGSPRVGHVVLMGSGEPFDNYQQVVKFLHLLRETGGVSLGLRNVSISTCGLVPQMKRFAEEGLSITLCISLHGADDEVRKKIMPIAHRYSIQEVLDAGKYYYGKTGRRIIIEYALMKGINDNVAQAEKLANLLRGMNCHVNLIALNEVKETGLKTVSTRETDLFLATLLKRKISATVRREMGSDIQGACGQLRRAVLEKAENENHSALS